MENMTIYKRLSEYYRSAALILLHAVVFSLLINLVLYPILWLRDRWSATNPITEKYSWRSVAAVYPHLTKQQIDSLLKETWSRPYVFEPFTQLKERPYRGHYVNVDENGFRWSANQGPWPPDPNTFNVFLFGGSTLFGYGVSDSETIASRLQEYLTSKLNRNIRVYNFGRGHYYSTQERILFEQLLSSGNIPDLAIFIDGINDFDFHKDEPLYTERLQQFVSGKIETPRIPGFISELPLSRVLGSLKRRFDSYFEERTRADVQVNAVIDTDKDIYDDPVRNDRVIRRYLTNKKIIEAVAASYGVKPVFVWQPVPTFKYDVSYHLFSGFDFGKFNYSRYGYRSMEELRQVNHLGVNFLWCADIQQGFKEPLYVDRVHYTAKFSRVLALCIADLLLERDLLTVRKAQHPPPTRGSVAPRLSSNLKHAASGSDTTIRQYSSQ